MADLRRATEMMIEQVRCWSVAAAPQDGVERLGAPLWLAARAMARLSVSVSPL
jgi:hypothetical protein